MTKLRVQDLCVTERGAEEEDEEKNDGIQNQKQEPHTKM